jgi:pimeloyl-ACP methyl ester carboxylesterase
MKRLFWITVVLILVSAVLSQAIAGQAEEAATARRFCEDFLASNDEAIAGLMDEALAAAMTPEAAQQVRDVLEATLGPVQEIGEAWHLDELQGYRRYRVPVDFRDGVRDLLVAFAPNGKVGGLFTVDRIEPPAARPSQDSSEERDPGTPELRRPQTPRPPFDYGQEDVTYTSGTVVRAGTLTIPKGPGRFPAVLLISGSGAQDRDSTLLGHRSFLLFADHLTRAGIAVLRVDDRGVGGSSGDLTQSTLSDFADDAVAGVRYLLGRDEIDESRIGILGHSEGGIVAPLAASRSKDVAFVVLLAGPGVPGADVMDLQMQLHLRLLGLDEKTIGASAVENRKLNKLIASGGTAAAITEQLVKLKRAQGDLTAVQPTDVAGLMTPWMHSFLTHDPRPVLTKIKIPILALNGELDFQVDPEQNLEAMRIALMSNRDATLQRLPGLNHLFQTAKTGALIEYSQIEETIAPAVLDLIRDWILKRTPSDAGGEF